MLAKKIYIQDEDFDSYQKVLRTVSHRYIHIIKVVNDSSAEEEFAFSLVILSINFFQLKLLIY